MLTFVCVGARTHKEMSILFEVFACVSLSMQSAARSLGVNVG